MSESPEFDAIVATSLDNVDSIQSLANSLIELKGELREVTPVIETADTKKQEIKNKEDALKQQMQALAEEKHKIESDVWDARKKAREIERNIKIANDRLMQAIENKKKREELDKLSEELDDLTKSLPWREWAFPHQIEGAKKLAVQKRAILADTMGLGKSLTSIIYMDMVKAKRILMIVPNDTTQNMVREIKNWAPHRNVVDASGLPKASRDFLLTTLPSLPEFVLIVNYEINRRDPDFVNNVLDLQIDTVIADESHNVKNTKTAAFKMTKSLLTMPNCCSECGSKNVYEGLG